MKILVTGGAGFIGSNVARILKGQGHEVFILDDFSHAHFKNILDLNCEVICGDVSSEDTFKKLPKLDAVIHEAAITDTTLPDDAKMMTVNYEGFKNVLEFCQVKRIRLVYASSAGVYGSGSSPMKETQKPLPLNTYAYSKYLCDVKARQAAQQKGCIPLVGLRYFNVYGPYEYHKGASSSMIYQLYLQMKENTSPRVFECGQQRRDFIYVKDVAHITIKALEIDTPMVLNVGTGKPRSFNDIIEVLNGVLNKDLPPEYFPNPYSVAYQDHTEADTTVLAQTLNIQCQYTLEAGISDYIHNHLKK
ncbi:MAG: ADP-glyceromanno-heptose 6-epimerase [Candidatus Omnitrophica bacterium]|nr:ADP-glyceromanno-heptose 6-epimerase [Candidatus Omnitrophota bacterium]